MNNINIVVYLGYYHMARELNNKYYLGTLSDDKVGLEIITIPKETYVELVNHYSNYWKNNFPYSKEEIDSFYNLTEKEFSSYISK